MTIHHQLVNISPKKIIFTPKYVDLRALSSVVASRIYALFVVKSTRVPRLGGGGQANLGNARIFTASITATPPSKPVASYIVQGLVSHHRHHPHHLSHHDDCCADQEIYCLWWFSSMESLTTGAAETSLMDGFLSSASSSPHHQWWSSSSILINQHCFGDD